MSDVINRTTLEYRKSVNDPDYSPEEWVINPDMSGVTGVDPMYWKLDENDHVVEMTVGEKNAAYLETLRTQKMYDIDMKTTNLIRVGFTYDSKVFSMSEEAQINWTNLYMIRTSLSYPYEVSTKDGGYYSFANESAMVSFYSTGLAFKEGIMAAGRTLRKSCLAAETIAELDAIEDTR